MTITSTDFNPFEDDKILDSLKMEEFADDNFKIDENGKMFSKRVQNGKETLFSLGASKVVILL